MTSELDLIDLRAEQSKIKAIKSKNLNGRSAVRTKTKVYGNRHIIEKTKPKAQKNSENQTHKEKEKK